MIVANGLQKRNLEKGLGDVRGEVVNYMQYVCKML